MRLRLIAFLLLAIFLSNCKSKNVPEEFDYGQVVDNIYTNNYFEFKMNIPETWVVLNEDEIAELMNEGKKIVAGNDEKMKKLVEASEINIANLLGVYKYELYSTDEYNPSIAIVAENIQKAPEIKNGGAYLYRSQIGMEHSQIQYDFIDDIFEKKSIGGKDFYIMNSQFTNMSVEVKQSYYATIMKGFCLLIILSYDEIEHKTEMIKSIESIKFKD